MRAQRRQNTPRVKNEEDIHVYYPFHAYAGCNLKSQQNWRVVKTCIIVGFPDGSRLKIPTWMASAEAAVFKISEEPTVSIEAMMLVCDLIENQHRK